MATDSLAQRGWTVLAAVVAAFAFAISTAASAEVVPVPTVTGPIPVDGDSHPFNSAGRAVVPVDLPAFGYVEEEYFLSGLANVYEWDVLFETVKVRTPDAPYTNRTLWRLPSNPNQFSGTVIVELFNFQGLLGYEVPFIWGGSSQYMLERGHVWIGVTANPNALAVLKTFDSVRYAPLSWDDPLPPEARCVPARETETGLLWDILSQIAALVKSDDPSNPLQGYDVEVVLATGQLGGGWPLYTNTIGLLAETANGDPVYDGYLIRASGSHSGPINQCAPRPSSTDPIAKSQSTEPVIRLHSPTDVVRGSAIHSGSTCDIRRDDSDDVLPYRHYEVPGASVAEATQVSGAPGPEDGARAGGLRLPTPHVIPPNEFPFRYLINGAFDNLDLWVRDGVPPPRAAFIQEAVPDCTSLVLDGFGSPVGGVRTPYLDVPINSYPVLVTANPRDGDPIPFDTDLLEELYGNHGNYVHQVMQETNELIRDRWVTREDGEEIRTEAAHSEVLRGP